MIKLLIVDDSPLMRRLLRGVFDDASQFEVEVARDGLEAMAKLHEFAPDVVTLDLEMPQLDGLACLKRIMLERPCPVVIISSLTDAGGTATLEAMQAGAVDFVPKPAGAVSLSMDEFGPAVRATVLAASTAKISKASRLVDRVRLQLRPIREDASAGPEADEASAPLGSLEAHHTIVLVGCSTGGPPALDALLGELPADFPCPIIVAQHMPSAFTGPLARRLGRFCKLQVREVVRPEPAVPGTVLIGKGDADVILARRSGRLVATSAPASTAYRWHPSVDRLVSSAMQHVDPKHLVGVLMTGMGDDGAATMTDMVKAGGRAIAESEETAVVWGMPGSLVKRGGASRVVPLQSIAKELREWLHD